MNLHVQQSVHVLAAQTYCQIAVGGGGAVKGVRHLKRTIPTILSWTLSTSKSSMTKLLLAMKKKRKRNDISADIRIATARFYVLPPWIRGDRTRSETRLVYPYTRGATRYRSSVDKMSDTSGLKRSDSPHKPNVDSRKIVLSLFTAQPSSIVSLKSCNVLLLSIPLYIPVWYWDPIVHAPFEK